MSKSPLEHLKDIAGTQAPKLVDKPTDEDWIQDAHLKTGAFTKQAHRAGFSDVQKYAKWVLDPKNKSRTTETTKRRARLAQTFANMHGKGFDARSLTPYQRKEIMKLITITPPDKYPRIQPTVQPRKLININVAAANAAAKENKGKGFEAGLSGAPPPGAAARPLGSGFFRPLGSGFSRKSVALAATVGAVPLLYAYSRKNKAKRGRGAVEHSQKPGFLLQTSDIDDYLKQRVPNFVGTYSKSHIPRLKKQMEKMKQAFAVINLDDNQGSHWITLVHENGNWFWLDPLGAVPPKIAIKHLNPYWNEDIYQDASGAECGIYAIGQILNWIKNAGKPADIKMEDP